MKYLLLVLTKYKRVVITNILLGLSATVLSLLSVFTMQKAIDMATSGMRQYIFTAVSLLALIAVFEIIARAFRNWQKNYKQAEIKCCIREYLIKRILGAQWRGKNSLHSGEIMNRLQVDVNNVASFTIDLLPSMLSTAFMILGAFAYLYLLDKTLALITIAIAPVLILLSRRYVVKMRRLFSLVRFSEGRVGSFIQETIEKETIIKALQAGEETLNRLSTRFDRQMSNVKRRTCFSILSNSVVGGAFMIVNIFAFLWGALRMSDGTLTFGGMVAFLQLVMRIQGPTRDIAKLMPSFSEALAASSRIKELDYYSQEVTNKVYKLKKSNVGIAARDLTFSYSNNGIYVLNHLTFDFKPSTFNVIVGETGVGKTTLIRLILGLAKPNGGSIEIYDDNGRYSISPAVRSYMAYVPQGNSLLSGTIRDNLLLACPKASNAQLRQALLTAQAGFVFDLPDGILTRVGEMAVGLSEGQAQRIAIARALLMEAPLLVMDEAASALDPVTEESLLSCLKPLNKTIILVSHRPRALFVADNILELKACALPGSN